MEKFCRNCGAALAEGTKFCPSCGMPIVQSAQPTQPQQQQHSRQSVYQQLQQYPPKHQVKIPEQFENKNEVHAQQNAEPAKQKKGKGGRIAVVSLVLVAAIVLGMFGFSDGGWFRASGKQVVEAKVFNPNLASEVTVKEARIPDGLDDKDKFEMVGKWYDVGSEGYDGMPLSGDVLLTVSIPEKKNKEDIGSYVFV